MGIFRSSLAAAVLVVACCQIGAAEPSVVEIPARDGVLHVARDLPTGWRPTQPGGWILREAGGDGATIAAQVVPAIAEDGRPAPGRWRALATVPPDRSADKTRRFALVAAAATPASPFCFSEIDAASLELKDGDRPAWVYNHRDISRPDLPEKSPWRSRSCYLHPVWSPDGAVLTDDFPADHPFHRGVFWAWPHVTVGGREHDLWTMTGIRQRFVQWLHRETGPVAAVLAVENGWFVGDEQVMTERVWIHTYRGQDGERSLDLSLVFTPGAQPVTLQGREGKSYGGLVFRFNAWPRHDAIVRGPGRLARHTGDSHESPDDLLDTPLAWADLASKFPGGQARGGAAIFVSPSHPDFPPTWMTRCYGPLCVGWPGVRPKTFEPGTPFALSYRIWTHSVEREADQIAHAYEAYVDSAGR